MALDPITIGLIGGAGLGLLGSAQKRKQQKMTADMRAAEIEASPWTGQGASTQISYAPSAWADLAQGGLGGAQLGSGLEASAADQKLKADWLAYMKDQKQPGTFTRQSGGSNVFGLSDYNLAGN